MAAQPVTEEPQPDPSRDPGDVRARCYAVAGALLITSSDCFRLLHLLTASPARHDATTVTGDRRAMIVAAAKSRAALAACAALTARLLLTERQRASADFPEIGGPSHAELGVTALERQGRPVWSATVR